MIRLLRPQSGPRVAWETRVCEQVARLFECDYGDASGFLGAHAVEVDELYAGGATPARAASVLVSMDGGE